MYGRGGAPKSAGTTAASARSHQKSSVAFFPNEGAAAAAAAAVSIANAIDAALPNGNHEGVAHIQIKIALHAGAQAARAAGCPVVLVRYGYNHGEPVDGVDADAHVDFLTQIPQALAGKA